MRLPSVLNWTLLFINALVLLLLLVMAIAYPCWNRSMPAARPLPLADGGAVGGMAIYYEIGPFVLLTGEDFPRDSFFVLRQRVAPLNPSLSVLDGKYFAARNDATKHVSMDLGADFSVSCDCSVDGGDVDISTLTLGHRRKGVHETLTDLNVDGVFDVRQTRDEAQGKSRMYVWYKGAWQEVLGFDKDPKHDEYHKQLGDGVRVSFDNTSGRWLSSTDKPAVRGE